MNARDWLPHWRRRSGRCCWQRLPSRSPPLRPLEWQFRRPPPGGAVVTVKTGGDRAGDGSLVPLPGVTLGLYPDGVRRRPGARVACPTGGRRLATSSSRTRRISSGHGPSSSRSRLPVGGLRIRACGPAPAAGADPSIRPTSSRLRLSRPDRPIVTVRLHVQLHTRLQLHGLQRRLAELPRQSATAVAMWTGHRRRPRSLRLRRGDESAHPQVRYGPARRRLRRHAEPDGRVRVRALLAEPERHNQRNLSEPP